MNNIHNGELHRSIFDQLIQRGKNEKWNNSLLTNICENLGVKGCESLLYPNGINDITDLLFREIDQAMMTKGARDILDWVEAHKLTAMAKRDEDGKIKAPVHKQIALYLYARFDILEQYKEVLPNIVIHLASPFNLAFAAKMVGRMADNIWQMVGDISTDYNYYTKRSLLGAVYCASVVYYLQDRSLNHNNTRLFIDKRLQNVLSIHRFKAKVMNLYKSSIIINTNC